MANTHAPGFDFLQNLMGSASAAMPSIGQWIAPTLNPEEIEKRIEELRAVQFWLEQNTRMLAATIQALEVQRMTLSTLRTMNVQMEDLRESLTIRMPGAAQAPQDAEAAPTGDGSGAAGQAAAASASAAGAVDPMQWWGALTQQFTELAASAMKDRAADTGASMADTMKQSMDAASQTLQRAAGMPAAASAKPARKAGAAKRASRKRSGGGAKRSAAER